MNKSRLLVGLVTILIALLTGILAATAQGPQPRSPAGALGTGFSYQGRLLKNDSPVNDNCNLTFSLWDSQSNLSGQVGGSQTLNGVAVADGLFTVQLNGAGQFGSGAFGGAERWLQIAAQCSGDGGPVTLSRQLMSSVPYALYAPVAGASNTSLTATLALNANAAVTAAAANSVPWSGITGLPAGFADGIDNDTLAALSCGSSGYVATWNGSAWTCAASPVNTYSAGSGLVLTGNTFSVDTATIQSRVNGACPAGQYLQSVNTNGSVTCAPDLNSGGTITNVTAGFGLSGGGPNGGVTLAVVTSTIQHRVTSTCLVGSAIRDIAADGSVTCEPVGGSAGGTITAVTAGSGLVGGGTSGGVTLTVSFAGTGAATTVARSDHNHDGTYVAINASAGGDLSGTNGNPTVSRIQGRPISSTLPSSGQVLKWDGTQWAPSADSNTTYAAGSGLALNNNTFSVMTSTIQSRVSGNCTGGQYMQTVNADGSVLCGTDANSGGTITNVSAGYGLTGGGSSGSIGLSVVTTTVQARVSGSCIVGQYVRVINADGTVLCGADANSGGTITGVTAGFGMSGGGTSGNVPLNVVTGTIQARVSGACASGSAIRAIDGSGGVTCETTANGGGTITGVTAGNGIAGGGITGTVTLTVNFAGNGIANTVARSDHNHDGVYLQLNSTAGGDLAGTYPNPTVNRLQGRTVTSTAPSTGQVLKWDGAQWGPGTDLNTTYSAGAGLSLTGNQFAVVTGSVQARVTGTCTAGLYLQSINADGTVVCGVDLNSGGTITNVSAGFGLSGGGSTGSVLLNVLTSTIQTRVNSSCVVGQYIRAINADGTVSCGTDLNSGGTITSVNAGFGLTGGGGSGSVTLAIVTGTVQARVSGSCTAGSSINAINADGSVSCGTPRNSTLYYPLGSPQTLDIAASDADLSGFAGGFIDGRYAYFVPNGHAKVARLDPQNYGAGGLSELNLGSIDGSLFGFVGGFSDGRYGYLVPNFNSKMARLDLQNFTGGGVTVLDLAGVDPTLGGYMGGFDDGRYGYLIPNINGKLTRVDLLNFASSGVITLDLTSVDAGLTGFRGGFTDGRYGYLVPNSNGSGVSGKVARIDLQNFTSGGVTVLDLSAVDAGLKGFQGGFSDGRYGYFVPSNNGAPSGKVARVDLSNFVTAGVTVLDLSAVDSGLKGFRGGFTDGRYGYFVPYNNDGGLSGKAARVDLNNFTASGVAAMNFGAIDPNLVGFWGGFSDGRWGYFVPNNNGSPSGKVARIQLLFGGGY